MIRFLSYRLTEDTPSYGGNGRLEITKEKSFEQGASCETFKMSLPNHYGTHVDCPAHFFRKGMRVAEVKANFWFFRSPQVIPTRLASGEVMGIEAVKNRIKKGTDLLLLKSGWSKKRGQEEYARANPGIGASVGYFLRSRYPSVRAIGFDWISLSSYLDQEEGRKAHRAFLNPGGVGRPLMIIEDMDLSEVTPQLQEVFVFPLRVDGIDSAPCTVVGKFSG